MTKKLPKIWITFRSDFTIVWFLFVWYSDIYCTVNVRNPNRFGSLRFNFGSIPRLLVVKICPKSEWFSLDFWQKNKSEHQTIKLGRKARLFYVWINFLMTIKSTKRPRYFLSEIWMRLSSVFGQNSCNLMSKTEWLKSLVCGAFMFLDIRSSAFHCIWITFYLIWLRNAVIWAVGFKSFNCKVIKTSIWIFYMFKEFIFSTKLKVFNKNISWKLKMLKNHTVRP